MISLSLARQWTMEDEEELERERRRKTRDPNASEDPDDEDGVASQSGPQRSENALVCRLLKIHC